MSDLPRKLINSRGEVAYRRQLLHNELLRRTHWELGVPIVMPRHGLSCEECQTTVRVINQMLSIGSCLDRLAILFDFGQGKDVRIRSGAWMQPIRAVEPDEPVGADKPSDLSPIVVAQEFFPLVLVEICDGEPWDGGLFVVDARLIQFIHEGARSTLRDDLESQGIVDAMKDGPYSVCMGKEKLLAILESLELAWRMLPLHSPRRVVLRDTATYLFELFPEETAKRERLEDIRRSATIENLYVEQYWSDWMFDWIGKESPGED